MFCKKCGAQMEDREMFCPSCGEKVVPEDGRANKRPLIIGLAAAAGTLVLIACVVILAGMLVSGGKRDTLIYLKGNEIVELSRAEGIVIGEKAYAEKDDIDSDDLPTSYVRLSEDGKYIYYPQKITGLSESSVSFDLYCRQVGMKNGEGVKIASDVNRYSLLKDGKVLYLSSGKMYLYNSKNEEKEKIASDVQWMRVSADEKQILWQSSDTDPKVYVCDTALKKEKVKIDSDVTSVVYTADNFDRIVYIKDTDLYVMMNQEDKQKIASDVSRSFVCKDGENVRFYYVKNTDEENLSYMDFIDDDMAAKDAEITEPRLADYQHTELVEGWYGPYNKTVTDFDAYDEARDIYNKKQTRDYYRESLKERISYTGSIQSQAIYEYIPDKDESNKIFEGYLSEVEARGYSVFLYESVDIDNIDKIAFSKLMEDTSSLYDDLSKALTSATQINMVYNGKSIPLSIDFEDLFDGNSVDDIMLKGTSDGTKQCYFTITSYAEGAVLCKTDFSKMDGTVAIVTEDSIFNVVLVMDDGAFYIAVDEDHVGDLYFDDKQIDSNVDVRSLLLMKNSIGVMYMTDTEEENMAGTLKWCDGTKSTEISDDVAYYRSNGKGEIAFITDYNFNKNKGDLKVYKDNKIRDIDDNVTGILLYN